MFLKIEISYWKICFEINSFFRKNGMMNNMSCSDDGNHDARNLFYIRINLKLIK